MAKYYLSILFIFCLSKGNFAQKADDIIGFYFVVDPFSAEETQIQIYKTNSGIYCGIVVWVKKEENRKYEGLEFLKGLKYNEKDSEWIDGKIKYPGKDNDFNVYMSFASDKKLKIRAYWGVSLLGKTIYWTKEDKKRTHK